MASIRSVSIFIFIALIASTQARVWLGCNSEPHLTCYMRPFGGTNVQGVVKIKPVWMHYGCYALITARITGLKPNSASGWHIHKLGNISKPQNVGPVYTHPLGWPTLHGLLYDRNKHWGSLGNLFADAKGLAYYRYLSKDIWSTQIILGRSMAVHLQRDQGRKFVATFGNVGGVSAQCVIGLVQ